MNGYHILGGLDTVGSAPLTGPKADIYTNPVYVIINPPRGLISTRADYPLRTVVNIGNGKRRKNYIGDPLMTAYENPASVSITFANGTKKLFTEIAFMMVKGGRQQYYTAAAQNNYVSASQTLLGNWSDRISWSQALVGFASGIVTGLYIKGYLR